MRLISFSFSFILLHMAQSPELAGGAGFTFSDEVVARYLAALLIGSVAPGLSERKVVRVALEQRDAGEPLDDIVVDGQAVDGTTARLSLQVKREITISAAPANKDFRGILRDCWLTIDKSDFRDRVDKVGAVVGPSTAVGKWRDLVALAEFANASDTPEDFAIRFSPKGSTSKEHRAILSALQKITIDLGRPANAEDLHKLLRNLVIIRFDALHDGATEDSVTIALVQQALAPGEAGEAVALSERLRSLARRGAGTARSWSRGGLRQEVAGLFRLAIDIWLAADIERLLVEARLSAASIADRIGDTTVDRKAIRSTVSKAIEERRLVALRGLPGTGKSVILRRKVEAALIQGPALLLKADRLTGGSWAQYANSLGLAQNDPLPLLREIAVLGTPILFIDGLDRIDKAQRGIVIDLISTIEANPELSNWRVLATLRDSGVEPVRTWLPSMFDGGRMASVEVGALNDEEAEELAGAQPGLRALLFGPEPVRTLVRRPFFARVLDRSREAPGETPRSEIELMNRWWSRGGFDAEGGQARLRQRALLTLVRLRALQPDAPVALEALDVGLLSILEELITDGVLEEAGGQHFVRFAHDIFFEWSFAQVLIGARSGWADELRAAGEAPIVARSLDLHAQAMFESDANGWQAAFAALSEPSFRGQWRRLWLLAPLNLTDFSDREDDFDAAVTAMDHDILRSAMVWFQAQHTSPNPALLNGSVGDFVDREVRLRAADLLGWPDDFRLWMRLLNYLDRRLHSIPHRLFPHLLTLFEVWQNALVDRLNVTSEMIVRHAAGWLQQLEHRHDQMGKRFGSRNQEETSDPWNDVEDLDEFERAVRRLLLRASRVEPERVSTYLKKFGPEHPARTKVFEDIMVYAPLLSQTHPCELADFAMNHFRRELPEDHQRRRLEEDRASATYREELRKRPKQSLERSELMSLSSVHLGYWGPDEMDWQSLSVERDPTNYFPASPLHQPFQALFENAPDEALRLVRSISNHAVEAWRQLHRLQPDHGTPISIEIEFPWGRQTFWGGTREYLWSRGLWAPKPLASAYLALDKWALDQVNAGADGDALIERIVSGNNSIAVLGIAIYVALARPKVSSVNEALVTTQRLWQADIQRFAQEHSIRSSSQIGFWREHHRKDALAVETLNAHAVRAYEIRNLATLHVFQADPEAALRVSRAIQAFADLPDYELEEDLNHPGARAKAAEAARTHAAWGDPAHYRMVDVPEQPEQRAIVMMNPIAEEPAIRERLASGQEQLQIFALFRWAEQSLAIGQIAEAMTIEQGCIVARNLDGETLFQPNRGDDQISMRRGAVAGAAAMVVAFAPTSAEIGWARSVLARAAVCHEEGSQPWSSVSVISWHHMIFVAHAAAAELRRDPSCKQHAIDLLSILLHPLDNVGFETVARLASLWDVAPHVSWVGLGLALDLCISAPEETARNTIHDPNSGAQTRHRKLDAALSKLNQPPEVLPIPPAPWVVADANDRRRVDHLVGNDEGIEPKHWRAVDGWWDSDRAGKILAKQPLNNLLAAGYEELFVSFCDAMLVWSIERLAPSWVTQSHEVNRADVSMWSSKFGELLGSIIGLIDPAFAEASFINPICAIKDDEPCFDLLAPLVTMFLCTHVMDSASVAPETPLVLERSLDRLLASPTFRKTSYRAGKINDHSMHQLAQWLMFVGFKTATLARRFANEDWSEIAIILPTVDRFVRTAGWAPDVMDDFLTLAERAHEKMPADFFADALLAALADEPDLGTRWRGTMIAARVASRIQDIADRSSPLPLALGQKLLRILDMLVDQGDRRSAALQISPAFRDLRVDTVGNSTH